MTDQVAECIFSYGIKSWKTVGKSDAHPIDQGYEPDLLFKYPNQPLNEMTWMFCYPTNVVQIRRAGAEPEQISYHGFVVTDEIGSKHYGHCCVFYQQLTTLPAEVQAVYLDNAALWKDSHISDTEIEYMEHVKHKISQTEQLLLSCDDEDRVVLNEKLSILTSQFQPFVGVFTEPADVLVPRCLGIMSRYPLYGFFKDWLSILVNNPRCSFEQCVASICYEVPLAPLGKIEVQLSMGQHLLSLSRPPLNAVPVIKNYSYTTVIACLGIDNLVRLFEFVCAERKILLQSTSATLLTLTAELVTSFLYPLYWQHIYIPVLPASMVQYIHAPVPYIIGILSSYSKLDRPPSDVLCVDLDLGTLTYFEAVQQDALSAPSKPQAAPLPIKERSKLISRLKQNFNVNWNVRPTLDQLTENYASLSQSSYDTQRLQTFQDKLRPVAQQLGAKYSKLIHELNNQLFKTAISSVRKRVETNKDLPVPPQEDQKPLPEAPTASRDSLNPKSVAGSEGSSFFDEMVESFKQASDRISGPQIIEVQEFDAVESMDTAAPLTNLTSKTQFLKSMSNYFAPNQSPPKSTSKESSIHSQSVSRRGSQQPDRSSSPDKQSSSFSFGNWIKSVSSSDVKSNADGAYFKILKKRDYQQQENSFVNVHHTGIDKFHPGQLPTLHQTAPRLLIVTPHRSIVYEHFTHRLLDAYCCVDDQAVKTLKPLPEHFEIGICHVCTEIVNLPFVPASRSTWQRSENIFVLAPDDEFQASEAVQCCTCDCLVHKTCADQLHHVCSSSVNEQVIQEAFVRLWSSLLKNYKAALPKGTDLQNQQVKNNFLASLTDGDISDFMRQLIDTQSFANFLDERSVSTGTQDFDLLLFDECIKAKYNRSKLKLHTESTPFLQDKSYQHSSVYSCPSLELGTGTGLPFELDTSKVVVPKRLKKLISDRDTQRLRIYTHSILRKARLEKLVNQQDLGSWVRDRVLRPFASQSNVLASQDSLSAAQRTSPTKGKYNEDRLYKANVNLTLDEIQSYLLKIADEELVDRAALDETKLIKLKQDLAQQQAQLNKFQLELKHGIEGLQNVQNNKAELQDAKLLLTQLEQRLSTCNELLK